MDSYQTTLGMNERYSDVAVIIPAYNEENSIRTIAEKSLQYSHHVIVVNDGSTDNTVEQLAGLPITLLNNPTNKGKGASLLQGFRHAQSLNVTATLSIDADTQHDPDDIPKFIHAMHQHPNHIIIGARLYNRGNAPKARYRANQIADFFISWAAGRRIIDSQSGYRLYPISLLHDCLKRFNHHKFTFESAILINGARRGHHAKSIAIQSHYPTNARASYYKPCADTIRIATMITWKIMSRGFCLPGLFRVLFKGVKLNGKQRKTSQTY